nr:MAG TPA: hypothetical protein [Caudoviricetes sp.]
MAVYMTMVSLISTYQTRYTSIVSSNQAQRVHRSHLYRSVRRYKALSQQSNITTSISF